MRFQTFSSSVRPIRVAVLTRSDDPEWQSTCLAIIEYLTKLWGGEHAIIVPTDGQSIDGVFWMLLSAYDPDVILTYIKTGEDLRRNQPKKFDEVVANYMQGSTASNAAAVERQREEISSGLARSSTDNFSLSPELTTEILTRLAPLAYNGVLEGHYIHAGDNPGHPFTSILDVLDHVEHSVQVIHVKNDSDAPSLWFAASLGWPSAEYLNSLNAKGVPATPVLASRYEEYDLIRWGIQPWADFPRKTAFDLSQTGLNRVRSTRARMFDVPTALVVGDSIQDFCLSYGLRRLVGRALWMPNWFFDDNDALKSRLQSALVRAHDLSSSDQSDSVVLISASRSVANLNALVTGQVTPAMISVAAQELTPSFIRTLVRHPLRTYTKGNTERLSTHPLIDDELAGPFESPKPDVLKAVNTLQHRWIVEVSFSKHLLPRHPSLGSVVAHHPNLGEDSVRVGNYGLAYLCPGSLVRGIDLEFNPLQPSIRVPDARAVFNYALAYCGYDCSISDKGRYEAETVEKLGGIEHAAGVFRDSKRRALLEKFLDASESRKDVYDDGVYLKDQRRYLNFAAILTLLGSRDSAIDLIDDFIARRIFYRGFIFRCAECSNVAWFSVDEVTQSFTCRRCSKTQQYRQPNWKHPEEPSWFYKLDEIVYQALANNGIVPILTLGALAKKSRDSFLFCPELRINLPGDKKYFMELDICCIPDGALCIGEAKSNGTLVTKDLSPIDLATKYRDLALKLGATRVVFATSTSSWNDSSDSAIDAAFGSCPHILVSKFVQSDL